jgi:hypothetical protein
LPSQPSAERAILDYPLVLLRATTVGTRTLIGFGSSLDAYRRGRVAVLSAHVPLSSYYADSGCATAKSWSRNFTPLKIL